MERYRGPILWSVILGIGFYFVVVFWGDFSAVKQTLATLTWFNWVVILGLSVLNYCLRFLRWNYYINELSGKNIPLRLHFAYYLAGFALSTTPGKAGESIRSLYLARHGVTFGQSISTLFVERLQDLLTIVLLSVLAAYHFEEYRVFLVVTVVIIFAFFPLVHSQRFLRFLGDIAAKLPGKLAQAGAHIVQLFRGSSTLLKRRNLYGGMMLGVIAWGAEGVGLWYTLDALGQNVEWMIATSVYGIAILVGALSFLPGGLGGTELVMGLLLVALGVDEPTAIAITLICRIATLWFAVFIGIVVAAVLALMGISPSVKKIETP